MLVVESIAKIRREHLVHGKSIKAIARERGVSRNTVRKVLRSGETVFRYNRSSQPLPRIRQTQPGEPPPQSSAPLLQAAELPVAVFAFCSKAVACIGRSLKGKAVVTDVTIVCVIVGFLHMRHELAFVGKDDREFSR